MRINKPCRLLVILLVALLPFAYMWYAGLIERSLADATMERLLRRGPMLLMAPVFTLWTIVLGLIVYSCVCWFKRPSIYTGSNMLLATCVLGVILIFFVHRLFYFSMPGDGPIP